MADSGLQIAEKASSAVSTASGPLIALAVALLALTLAVLLVAYINGRLPKD